MPRKAITDEKQRSRQHWAWYMYDFGNSAYAAVILLAVFAAYFKGTVVGGAEGSRLWGLALGAAMVVVAILTPILGAFADFAAWQHSWLHGDVLASEIDFWRRQLAGLEVAEPDAAMLPEKETPP